MVDCKRKTGWEREDDSDSKEVAPTVNPNGSWDISIVRSCDDKVRRSDENEEGKRLLGIVTVNKKTCLSDVACWEGEGSDAFVFTTPKGACIQSLVG